MKIKIFESDISDADLENKISNWTSEINPDIVSVSVNIAILNDYYVDSAPPMICNTWYRYVASVIYN